MLLLLWNLDVVFIVQLQFFLFSLVIFFMASVKIFEIAREGKNLRLRISANDLTVARISRAFQESKQ